VSEQKAERTPGTPGGETPAKKKAAENEDGPFSQVKKTWGWLLIGLGVLTQGVFGYIQSLLQPYFSVWQILWATLPLTAAVAICVFLAMRDVNVSVFGVSCIVIATLFASALTGVTSGARVVQYLYHPENRCGYTSIGYTHGLCPEPGYSAPSGNLVWAVLSGYVHFYGIIGFIRAVLVGCFVGFGADRLIAGVAKQAKRLRGSGAGGGGGGER
jgi:hypothetical protein